MELLAFFILPGFIYYSIVRLKTYQLTELNDWRLFFSVLLASFYLALISIFLKRILPLNFFIFNIPQELQEMFNSYPKYSEVFCNSIFLALILGLFQRIPFERVLKFFLNDREINFFNQSDIEPFPKLRIYEIVLIGLKCLILILPFSFWKLIKYVQKIIFLYDQSLSVRYLDKLENQDELLCQTTLKSGKVYIGNLDVHDRRIDGKLNDCLVLRLVVSGYRDPENQIINLTTFYSEYEDASIMIYKEEIVSISDFNPNLMDKFITQGSLINKIKKII